MNELTGDIKDEVQIRGQIIALSLHLEDLLTKEIYSAFKPKEGNPELVKIYLDDFILPLAFGKKVSLYKKLLKTDGYQIKISQYLKSQAKIPKSRNLHTNQNLNDFLSLNLSDILETRNLVAQGINVNRTATEQIGLKEGSFVFANGLKPKMLNNESLKAFSEKTLITAFIIATIRDI